VSTAESTGTRLGDALREHAAAGFSGLLRVDGRPGGTLYFADGGVAGCETPGAPGLEAILLRSHRVNEADWNAAFSAAAMADRPLTDELVDRELLRAGEAEALLRTALADAVFAVLNGTVERWATAPAADCPLPLDPPAAATLLLGETARRSQVLAAFGGPAVSAADRFTALPPDQRADPAGLTPGREALLALADVRRTVRDLAFALGRGLYATMLELARMRDANLVTVAGYDGEPAPAGRIAAAPAGGPDEEASGGLPRRRQDRPGSHRATEPGRRIFTPGIRLLRPRAEGGSRLAKAVHARGAAR
jgi:hypothetical protein